MPVITSQQDRPLCPPGPTVLTLLKCELREMDSFDKTSKVQRLVWEFITKRLSPEGEPFEIVVFTGVSYGDSRAKLTWLLDMLVPGITKKQADNLDTDVLVGGKFEAQIKHSTSATDSTRVFAEPVFMRPLQPGPFDDPQDPFVNS